MTRDVADVPRSCTPTLIHRPNCQIHDICGEALRFVTLFNYSHRVSSHVAGTHPLYSKSTRPVIAYLRIWRARADCRQTSRHSPIPNSNPTTFNPTHQTFDARLYCGYDHNRSHNTNLKARVSLYYSCAAAPRGSLKVLGPTLSTALSLIIQPTPTQSRYTRRCIQGTGILY